MAFLLLRAGELFPATFMENPPSTSTIANEYASVWMKRGIVLLNANMPASLAEAVQCFDRAIELRRTLPLHENLLFRYGLAAGWMNRGDALTRLGENLGEALRSYDEALAVLRELPVELDPRFRRRHAIAWLNRGITLQAQNTTASLSEAVRSIERTIALLENSAAENGIEERRILAAAWMNRGNVLLQESFKSVETGNRDLEARVAAKKSLALGASDEEKDLVFAEIGFKARHVLCRAAARLLENPVSNARAPDDLLAEATDAVDDAMRLARHWELQGVSQFRPLAAELFRFGCLVYQTRQPHFLTEFLLENLDPARTPGALQNREMHAAAVDALWRNFRKIQRDGFKAINTPRFEQLLEQLRDFRVTDERLRELRQRTGAK